jgi:hypothetical protein
MTSVSDINNETVKLTVGVWLSTSDFGAASRDLSKAAKMSFDKVRVSAEQPVDKGIAMSATATAPAE